MAFFVQGAIAIIPPSIAALFLAATHLGAEKSQPLPPTVTAPSVPKVVKPPPPQTAKDVLEKHRVDFLQRVAGHKRTFFNQCFTSIEGDKEIAPLPENVALIRNGSAVFRKASSNNRAVDYNLQPLIVLDPGHVPGFEEGAAYETTVVSAVAAKLKPALEQEGFEVIGTRAPAADGIALNSHYKFRDQERVLQWRAEISYKLAAEFPKRPVLFLSLHADAIEDHPDISGGGAFYYEGDGSNSASARFARHIAAHYRPPNGSMVKRGDYAVLRCQHAQIPAVLLELEYLTSETGNAYLRQLAQGGRQTGKAVNQIVAGIKSYSNEMRREQEMRTTTTLAYNNVPKATP